MHLSDTSSIAQHLKKHSRLKTEFRTIIIENTTIFELQNIKKYTYSQRFISEKTT